MIDQAIVIQTEDKERLNLLFNEIGDIISRNNNEGLELDWEYYCEVMFGRVTGFGQEDDEDEEPIPEVFRGE